MTQSINTARGYDDRHTVLGQDQSCTSHLTSTLSNHGTSITAFSILSESAFHTPLSAVHVHLGCLKIHGPLLTMRHGITCHLFGTRVSVNFPILEVAEALVQVSDISQEE